MTIVFKTSGTSYTLPSDWNSANNSIETIAGGGGAYSKTTNFAGTPGNVITVAIGLGGAGGAAGASNGTDGGDTYFNGANLAGSTVGAQKGLGGTYSAQATGGLASNGTGTTKWRGGDGGGSAASAQGGGGGAAGGPKGAGL